jgi:hypothetical protein
VALLDTLNLHTGKGPAMANRVKLLLERLADSDDHATLLAALYDPSIRHASLTKALQAEYGQAVVTATSVRDYRERHLTQVDGL